MNPIPSKLGGIPTVVVVTIVQGESLDRSLGALSTIQAQRIVLFNSERKPTAERRIAEMCDRLVTPGRNLGVAAGRNLLFKEAVSIGAKVILSLDDDLHVPTDYVATMSEALLSARANDPTTAIMGPAIISGRSLPPIGDHDVATMRDRMQALAPLLSADVDHAGIARWELHYLRAHGRKAADARAIIFDEVFSPAELDGAGRSDPEVRAALVDDAAEPLPTDVLGGGSWVLHTDVLQDLGLLDERLSGFGYEDSEYCIRARLRGRTNYLVPSVPVLHDPAGRGAGRSMAETLWRRNRFRGLIATDLLSPALASIILAESLALVAFEVADRSLADSEVEPALASAYRGLVHGLALGSGSDRNNLRISRRGASVELRQNNGSIRVWARWAGGSLCTAIEEDHVTVETDDPRLADLLGS